MTYSKIAMAAMTVSLLSANVNADVNTGTTMSANGTVTFEAANVTSHTIANVANLNAGSSGGSNILVGTGTVVTDAISQVALQPGADMVSAPGRLDADFYAPGATSGNQIHLAITVGCVP